MLFNSIEFSIFLVATFTIYWFVVNKKLSVQNVFLLTMSYVFYGWFDWRFLFLLAFSTFLDYYTGQRIGNAASIRVRKTWLSVSIVSNLIILGFFKYFNFFSESFSGFFQYFGVESNPVFIEVILPLGISFYTFHGLSYVLDIYARRIAPADNCVNYALFVSFFPLLVAGPIERATHLLPQIQKPRVFTYLKAVDRLRQIAWGFFKKIVIADPCGDFANMIFDGSGEYSGSTLLLGAIFFSFQIYGDFSGYSDIALGTARLFGFELLQNFSFPYLSQSIAEFWRRWHISLTSWFRDYVYIPLGGSQRGMLTTIRNVFIIFLISGLWHGANWTFITWGAFHAIFIVPSILFKRNRAHIEIVAKGKIFPSVSEALNVTVTFLLVSIAWIFFGAENLPHAISYLMGIFSASIFSIPEIFPVAPFVSVVLFMTIEWIGREQKYGIENFALKWPRTIRWAFYYAIVIAVFIYFRRDQHFIYFQF